MAINSPNRRAPRNTPELESRRTDQRYLTIRAISRYLLIAFGIWQGRMAVEALAGQDTSVYVRAVLGVFADLHVSILVALAGATTVWALFERILRHRIIVRLHTRIQKRELGIDPERSTSGLTTRGQTNPEDRGT
jgi:hypothetical protein